MKVLAEREGFEPIERISFSPSDWLTYELTTVGLFLGSAAYHPHWLCPWRRIDCRLSCRCSGWMPAPRTAMPRLSHHDLRQIEDVITLLGGATIWPLAARAQQPNGTRRIAVLFATGQNDIDAPNRIAAMRELLKNAGWIEGKNVWIDIRFGDGDTNLIQRHAAELVAYNPDVILVLGTVVVSALKRVTRSIPIVFVQVSDPVQAGFVSSLAHPGEGSLRTSTQWRANGFVSRVTPVHTAVRNCTRDEGRPFEVGNQVLISSHRKLLSSKAMVVNVAEKSERDFGRYD